MRIGRRRGALTGTVEVPSCRHIVHDPFDSEEDPLSFLSIKGRESLGSIGLVEERRRVRLGHPYIAVLELVRDVLRKRIRGKDDPLNRVEDVEQQSRVYRSPEVECHVVQVQEGGVRRQERLG